MSTIALEAPAMFVLAPRVKTVEPAVQVQQPETGVSGNLSDEDLVSEICRGAEWAIELLYQRYHRYAYALAYRILHESSAAEDIVQEAFLSIWRKAASYQKQQGSVHSWLQAIVHHRAIDKLRSAAHRDNQWVPLEVENEQDLAGGVSQGSRLADTRQSDVWEEAWRHEQRTLICSVLEQLPPEQRQVIELAYFGGYTHTEIAEQWHIPLGTVKGRMRLGLQKMKHLLQERGLDAAW